VSEVSRYFYKLHQVNMITD